MGEGLKDAKSKKISSLGGYPEVIHLSSPAHTETSEKETPILTSLPLLPFSLPPTLFVLGCLTRYPSTNSVHRPPATCSLPRLNKSQRS